MGADYYPAGGLGNIKDTFDTFEQAEEEAFKIISEDSWSNVTVADRDTMSTIKTFQ